MIAVIADDLTGAAEIAGISLRFGLHARICLHSLTTGEADVIIVCTDSRSMNKQNAIAVNDKVIDEVIQLSPAFIFKKIDSVMRGYVLAETSLLAEKKVFAKVIIAPANPSLQRTIQNKNYYIGDKKITSTGFAFDPEFPARSDNPAALLGDGSVPVLTLNYDISHEKMFIAEVASVGDVEEWAAQIEDDWLAVGGGDLFTAILKKQFHFVAQEPADLYQPFLYVSGTAYDQRREFVKNLSAQDNLVSWLPATVTNEWSTTAANYLHANKKLIIAIENVWASAEEMRHQMAKAVKEVLEKSSAKEIFIEGGATAAALLQALGITTLLPVQELERGVVRMKAGNYFVTLKPGSYPLPGAIESIFQN